MFFIDSSVNCLFVGSFNEIPIFYSKHCFCDNSRQNLFTNGGWASGFHFVHGTFKSIILNGNIYLLIIFSLNWLKFRFIMICFWQWPGAESVGSHFVNHWWSSSLMHMMTSSNGNIFRVTGHLCGEFTGPRWIPHTKASDAELWCFPWSTSE